jgi:hypothetical protein
LLAAGRFHCRLSCPDEPLYPFPRGIQGCIDGDQHVFGTNALEIAPRRPAAAGYPWRLKQFQVESSTSGSEGETINDTAL